MLTSLDVSRNVQLEKIDCGRNQLTALNVGHNAGLKELMCRGNRIVDLDVSPNAALVRLNCSENELKNINVMKNRKLKFLESAPMPTLVTLFCPRDTVYTKLAYPITATVDYK